MLLSKKQCVFSIVIANYNHGKYLEYAIKSIISQSFNNYELIVIDANSNDCSLSIIKKYEKFLSYWVSEPDSGQSEAFNKGFRKAKGDYFFWLNADDIIMPNSLQIAADYIFKHDRVDWISANTIFFDADNKIIRCSNGPKWNTFLFNRCPINVYGPTSIFSKKLYHNVGGFDETLHYGMDTDLWLRFRKRGYKFHKINSYFWGFRIHKESKTSHAFNEKRSIRFEIESQKILTKNNVKYNNKATFLLKGYKVMDGSYLRSFIDTIKYRSSEITTIQL